MLWCNIRRVNTTTYLRNLSTDFPKVHKKVTCEHNENPPAASLLSGDSVTILFLAAAVKNQIFRCCILVFGTGTVRGGVRVRCHDRFEPCPHGEVIAVRDRV